MTRALMLELIPIIQGIFTMTLAVVAVATYLIIT
jgi:hypothetical protein